MLHALQYFPSNAEMISQVAELYLKDDMIILDPTYGRGMWWKKWKPKILVARDLATTGHDYTHMPDPNETFDAVAFDPPYVVKGGRETSGITEFDDRYGLKNAAKTPKKLLEETKIGLSECFRVVKPGGIVLLRTMSYISSGKRVPAVTELAHYASTIGFEELDMLIYANKGRMQPPGRRQVHFRNNYSVLFVFRRPI